MSEAVRRTRWLLLLLALAACGGGEPAHDAGTDSGAIVRRDARESCPPPLGAARTRVGAPPRGLLDDVLRIEHVQVKGTHNSYHVRPEPYHPAWNYTHLPLDQQLADQGVRQVELDVWMDPVCGRFEVYHVGFLDEVTTCRLLTDCLDTMRSWSDDNPGHPPLFIQIEPKDSYDPATARARLAALEAEILSIWPRELLITPDDVRGAHATLREAIVADGWPTLGDSRGKALFFMNDGGGLRDEYTEGRTTLEGRLMFAEAGPGEATESVLVLNDPSADAARIAEAVALGFLVRTRADADGAEAAASDTSRRDLALASGAHMISTDFPAAVEGIDYWVELPGGAPSRCNPVTAPPECTAEAVSLQR